MLARTKNDNEKLYPLEGLIGLFYSATWCLSAMKNPFFGQASIGQEIVRWVTSTKWVRNFKHVFSAGYNFQEGRSGPLADTIFHYHC